MTIKSVSSPVSMLWGFSWAIKDMGPLDTGRRLSGSCVWWRQVSLKESWARFPAARGGNFFLIPSFGSFSLWVTTRKHGELWNRGQVSVTCPGKLLRAQRVKLYCLTSLVPGRQRASSAAWVWACRHLQLLQIRTRGAGIIYCVGR